MFPKTVLQGFQSKGGQKVFNTHAHPRIDAAPLVCHWTIESGSSREKNGVEGHQNQTTTGQFCKEGGNRSSNQPHTPSTLATQHNQACQALQSQIKDNIVTPTLLLGQGADNCHSMSPNRSQIKKRKTNRASIGQKACGLASTAATKRNK